MATCPNAAQNHAVVGRPNDTKRDVDTHVFWAAPIMAGGCGHHRGVDLYCRIYRRCAAPTAARGRVVCAVSSVGQFC